METTIEFKKEVTIADGSVWYFTVINKIPVSGSFFKDKDDAYRRFLKIIESKGEKKTLEVLETKTIK